MIALEQARQYLETLGLKQAVEILDNTLDSAASKQLPYPDMLAEPLGAEVAARRERYLTTRTRLAHLPFQRTLEQFDFAFQPSIVDELGFVPLSTTGAELLFEVFSQRYERGSILVTTNLPFDEWTEVFGSERLTGALLDRLTHHVHILEMNGESYRLKHSRENTDFQVSDDREEE